MTGFRILEDPPQTLLNSLVESNNCFWVFCFFKYFFPPALADGAFGYAYFSKQSEMSTVYVTGI